MPRTRSFDRDDALEAALGLFWAKGYEGTSLADLTRAMGLSKSSLYDTFGDKHALFLAAFDRYADTRMRPALAILEDDGRPARIRLEAFLRRFITLKVRDGDRRGCMIGNTAVELAPHDEAAAARVKGALAHIEEALHTLLAEARDTGEIDPGKDPRALARFLTAMVQGLRVLSKADADPRALDDVVRQTLSVLDV
ncbi:TetR/AcrR family transcriptional regulator [Caenispirillum salinarum]|uniref:TetR/AcrR family transcriptional regulator n=1 Tax=Caenispirillum salinarum TaxID=859058 RepID=UPI00384B093D